MFKNIIDLLTLSEYKGVSENIEIAKGKYQIPSSWKAAWYKIKRYSWQTKQSK
jgi:hypothetical protein